MAIAALQRAVGIEPTGIADDATQRALFESTVAAPEETTTVPEEPLATTTDITAATEQPTASTAQEETIAAAAESATDSKKPTVAPEVSATTAPEEPTTTPVKTTPNLLKNPEWESGAVRWLVTTSNEKVEFQGHTCIASTNSQDLTITEDMVGKTFKFSGDIAVSSSDATQEAIGLSITSYKADDTEIATDTVVEMGKEFTPHEVSIYITPDTDHITVSVTIWKQGTKNIFYFDHLRLEEVEKKNEEP